MRFVSFFVLLFFVTASNAAFAADILAKRTLRVGVVLGPADLTSSSPEGQSIMRQMLGLEMRRAVYAGHPVTHEHLGPPTLVQRNEIVAMVYRVGGLGIRTEGRALTRGGQGEVVEIMNLSSRQTVRAIVTGTRQVEVRR